MSTTNDAPAQGGLRAAKKEQAQARKTKAPAKAPAKKAPAKAPAKKAATTPTKLGRWTYEGERGKSPQQATRDDGAVYRIDHDGEGKWKATVTPAGSKKAETLVAGVGINAAYARCVKHAKGEVKDVAA